MRILFISAGLPPKHPGGLAAYVAELLDALVARGHQLSYLDPTGLSFWPISSLRKRAESRGASEYELFNSGPFPDLGIGTSRPKSEVRASRRVRQWMERLLARERPDIVHVHELVGLPLALLDQLKRRGLPVIFTAQDYFAICPTVKLIRRSGELCDLSGPSLTCDFCCQYAPIPVVEYAEAALRTADLDQISPFVAKQAHRVVRRALRVFESRPAAPAYVERRADFVAALSRIDAVICMSKLQADLFRRAGVADAKVRQMTLARRSYGAGPLPRGDDAEIAIERPMRVIALNVHQAAKGADVLLREFAILRDRGVPVELHVYGRPLPAADNPRIINHGSYEAEDLDRIAAAGDVGIVPSVWWEAYGYVGVELLTRGVPLLVSRIGAMSEYVCQGVTGRVFNPHQPGAMADIVQQLVSNPESLAELRRGAAEAHHQFQTFDEHVSDVEAMYAEFTQRPT